MSRSRKTGGSVFGLALVSMLVFGAFAASGAQASLGWHVGGKTLAELGKTEAPVGYSGSTLSIEWPDWGLTVNCEKISGSGTISGVSGGVASLTADKCSVPDAPPCTVPPMKLWMHLGLVEKEGVVTETFKPLWSGFADFTFGGEECPMQGMHFTLFNSAEESLVAEVPLSGNLKYITWSSSSIHPKSSPASSAFVTLSGSLEQRYSLNPTLALTAW
jgi:hypothetical protein